MGLYKYFLSLFLIAIQFSNVLCCEISGITNQWVDLTVIDTDRGTVFEGNATDVASISSASHSGDDLTFGPYFNATLDNGVFTLSLSDNYNYYEEYESTQSMSYSITFSCSTSGTLSVVFIVSVIDTNNNAPVFTDPTSLTYTITPPLSIGYSVTGCDGYIAVRDIDLTTQSIEFSIEENEYFEIVYDSEVTSELKTFGAILKTTGVIRSLTENLTLTIYATDVDLTGDDPLTTSATLTIIPSNEFQYPDEPIFSQAYYIGTYTEDDQLTFSDNIYLKQGYDSEVTYNLTGDYATYFTYQGNDNEIAILLTSSLPSDVTSQEIYLVLCAEREYTSGDCSTLIIQTPKENTLIFEKSLYEGTIEDNNLELQSIILIQGYEDGINVFLQGEYAEYFTASITNNNISITMNNFESNVLYSLDYLLLELIANSTTSSAVAVIALEVITEEIAAPMFDKFIYTGNYNIDGTFEVDEIVLSEGYDNTVTFSLEGVYANYFTIENDDNIVNLQLVDIPEEILQNETEILLSIIATKTNTSGTNAAIFISLPSATPLIFEQTFYEGKLENNTLELEDIILLQGFEDGFNVTLLGDYAEHFTTAVTNNYVYLSLVNPETTVFDTLNFIILELTAVSNTSEAVTVIALEVVNNAVTGLMFDKLIYMGNLSSQGVLYVEDIVLSQGFDGAVTFSLEGGYAGYFTIGNNDSVVNLQVVNVPDDILENDTEILLTIIATKSGTTSANAAIFIALPKDSASTLVFEKSYYSGTIENNSLILETIVLTTGYSTDVEFTLTGDYASSFVVTNTGNQVTISINETNFDSNLLDNTFLILSLEAIGSNGNAGTTIVLDLTYNTIVIAPLFSSGLYSGYYANSSYFEMENISLTQGYDEDVQLAVTGVYSQYFSLTNEGSLITLSVISDIPLDVIYDIKVLVFTITASKPITLNATAAIYVTFPKELTEATVMMFSKAAYEGSITNNYMSHETILLDTGYDENTFFTLSGEFSTYFLVTHTEAQINITIAADLPALALESKYLILELSATRDTAISASTSIVIEIIGEENCTISPVFSEAYYEGDYSDDTLELDDTIYLVQGYSEGVTFELEGDDSEWFTVQQNGNSVTLGVTDEIKDSVIGYRNNLLFSITATTVYNTTGRCAVSINLPTIYFSSPIYFGDLIQGVLQHEDIIVNNYDEDIVLVGEYSNQFSASLSSGVVTVQAGTMVLSNDTTFIVLELQAGNSSTVLVIDVLGTDEVQIPVVSFDAVSQQIQVDITKTGLIGSVRATASTGERLAYSLQINDSSLSSRVWINSDGDIYLSATASSGVYFFQVVATTVITRVSASSTVQLTVDAITVCGTDDNKVLPPLIVLTRDEEISHESLVTLNEYDGCYFVLNNRWPIDQQWLYVNESGLHTTPIDREDPSIAFMALSQIQVELILDCETNTTSRKKRALVGSESLGPYDYGSNNWVLSETILYNSRRSYVNLIVNDINDNAPVFVGKEDEPLTFGYPVQEILSVVRPRALAQLNATDADIGINAKLVYWSSDSKLAVSPTSGLVYFADNSGVIEDGATFQVNVTDQDGEGLTSSVQIMVRQLTTDNIAIITISNVFTENEQVILNNLTQSLGYDVKAISSFIISNDEGNLTRKANGQRNVVASDGSTFQLFVYGLVNKETVTVNTLISDVNSKVELDSLNIITTVSLEDHLETLEIVSTTTERDIGLLVATIVLSILLFIVTLAITIWYFLKWRKDRKYDGLSEENSLASKHESPALGRPESTGWPKPNIEEIKRNERRLQDMLDGPNNKNEPQITIPAEKEIKKQVLTPTQTSDPYSSIVIQSIDKLKDSKDEDDDDDEFGEKRDLGRRKSVVTFNENVEKIIHVVDNPDDTDSLTDLEIERL